MRGTTHISAPAGILRLVVSAEGLKQPKKDSPQQ
jgi:hypothetical protein